MPSSPLGRPTTVVGTGLVAALLIALAATTPSLGAEPVGEGMLRVEPSPAVATQIVVDGVPRNGAVVSSLTLAAGVHRVCVSVPAGYLAPPCQDGVIETDRTTVLAPTIVPGGNLRVVTEPSQSMAAITVDGTPRDQGSARIPVAVGTHEVCFGDVTGMVTPACQSTDVSAGAETTVTGVYTALPATSAGITVTLAGAADRGAGNAPWSARVTIGVVDGEGQARSGVEVGGSWATSRPAATQTDGCVTDAAGTCTVEVVDMSTGGGNLALFAVAGVRDDTGDLQVDSADRSVLVNRNGATSTS